LVEGYKRGGNRLAPDRRSYLSTNHKSQLDICQVGLVCGNFLAKATTRSTVAVMTNSVGAQRWLWPGIGACSRQFSRGNESAGPFRHTPRGPLFSNALTSTGTDVGEWSSLYGGSPFFW
jgi:hypothetical protein